MTQLLVSVRSLAECELVLQTSVGLIDVKEPRKGSLGAAEFSTASAIQNRMAGEVRPWSLALGELREAAVGESDWKTLTPSYAKFGLSGTAHWPGWQQHWKEAMRHLSPATAPVAVAYADAEKAESASWREILEAALRLGSRVLLVDTFDKSAGRLRAWMDDEELFEIRQATRSEGMALALAGSLTCDDIVALSGLRPDWFAVRSLVTSAERAAPVDLQRVQSVLQLLGDSVGVSLSAGRVTGCSNS